MKKLFCALILVMLILTGCKTAAPNKNTSDFKIIFPTDNTVNGYREPQAESSDIQNSVISYYANTKTYKFHFSDCVYAQKTTEENLLITNTREELITEGYSPCKKCNP